MRSVRLFTFFTATALAASLAACGSSGDPGKSAAPANPATQAPAAASTTAKAPAATGPATVELPPAPDGKWRKTGDLCGIITPAVAAKALGYSGPLEAMPTNAQSLPYNGIDACNYSDSSQTANLVVLKYTDELWAQSLREVAARNYPAQQFSVRGADGAFFAHYQGFAHKGTVMVGVNNPSPGGLDPAGLVRLAALAATIVNKG